MERRYHDRPHPGAPLAVHCRHCASLNYLSADQVEITNGRAWARCEVCQDWYLVRWDDAAALGIVKPANAVEVPD